jgi:hypothetical protein
MPNTKELLQWIDQWWMWVTGCMGQPMAAPACRPLWEGVWMAAAVIGAWLLLWAAWRWIDQRMKYNAAIRAQMERERIAEPAVMAEHKFQEAGDVAADVTDPHLARTIREELDRQKQARITGKTLL